jgi:PEP-CTERM motif
MKEFSMKRQLVLALTLSLALVSGSFADFSIGYDPGVDLGNGLVSYQVYVTGTTAGGAMASAMDSLSVSQCVNVDYGYGQLDMESDWIPKNAYDPVNPANAMYDTHILTPEIGNFVSNIGEVVETNDGSLGLLPGAGIVNLDHIMGMGSVASSQEVASGWDPISEKQYIMQVVVPCGEGALVSANIYGTDSAGNASVCGVPEPSTIIMLVLGALCLLIRRK